MGRICYTSQVKVVLTNLMQPKALAATANRTLISLHR